MNIGKQRFSVIMKLEEKKVESEDRGEEKDDLGHGPMSGLHRIVYGKSVPAPHHNYTPYKKPQNHFHFCWFLFIEKEKENHVLEKVDSRKQM